MNVAVITHAVFIGGKDIYGPAHAASTFLNQNKIAHLFIKHSLESTGHTIVEIYKHGSLSKQLQVGPPKRIPSVGHYIWELMLTLYLLRRYGVRRGILLGYDPLNALACYVAQFIYDVKKTVYISADFATTRFANTLLNKIYHSIDQFVTRNSDQVWSVSKRIQVYRKSLGVSESKNKHTPNAPFFDTISRTDYIPKNRFNIVVVSAIENTIDFKTLIDAFATCAKKYDQLRLHIVGSGSRLSVVKNHIKKRKVLSKVVFHGVLSHEDMFKVLVNCGIGVALYHEADPTDFRYYSDPMKIRDYLASGLPVIVSGNSGLGYEVEREGAGIKVALDTASIEQAIDDMLTSERTYKRMRTRAIAFAQEHDSGRILHTIFSSLGLSV